MIESEQPRPQANNGTGAYGTEMASVSQLRRDGTINRDNELEDYPVKGATSDGLPRYSQIDGVKPSAPHAERVAPVSPPALPMLEPEPGVILPPSYDEVIREKQTESV